MLEMLLGFVAELLCCVWLHEADPPVRKIFKVVFALLFVVGVVALIYYVFIKP